MKVREWLNNYDKAGVDGCWPDDWPREACDLIDSAWEILSEIERTQTAREARTRKTLQAIRRLRQALEGPWRP